MSGKVHLITAGLIATISTANAAIYVGAGLGSATINYNGSRLGTPKNAQSKN